MRRRSLMVLLSSCVIISLAIPALADVLYMDNQAVANTWHWSGTYTIKGGRIETDCVFCSVTGQTFKNASTIYYSTSGGGSPALEYSHSPVSGYMSRCKINGNKHLTCHAKT